MAASKSLFIAKQGALVTLNGARTVITPGMIARAGASALESYPHLFAPLTVDFDVEPAKPAKQAEAPEPTPAPAPPAPAPAAPAPVAAPAPAQPPAAPAK